MPKFKHAVTGQTLELDDKFIGIYPYELVVEENLQGYVPGAIDGDNDGRVQDGTEFEREVGTELTVEEQKKAVAKKPRRTTKKN